MTCLVDTHVFLWAAISPKKISRKVKNLLLDPENTKMVSIVSFWEISLKYQLGKIDLIGILPDELPKVAKKIGFEILNLDADIASSFYKLPKLSNKDPFDRMLSWQTICQECHLITQDPSFSDYKNYGLKTIW